VAEAATGPEFRRAAIAGASHGIPLLEIRAWPENSIAAARNRMLIRRGRAGIIAMDIRGLEPG
jgi:hypothetical protein